LAFKITPKNLGGAIGAIDRLYYRSSPNVVFAVDNVKPYHTENKTLVLEWPTFTDVYSFTDAYSGVISKALFCSRMFLDHPDPDPSLFVWIPIWIWMRIRVLPSSNKKSKKNLGLHYIVFRLFYDFLSLKNDVNVSSNGGNKEKIT
jgi:hypothetical protein